MRTIKNLDHFDSKEKASERARKMLADTRAIRDFGYHGDLDLAGHSQGLGLWGFSTLVVHRDSDVLARSNWAVITADLLRRFPESIEVVNCSHWAVGWLDHLAVKWTAKNGIITLAGLCVLEWIDQLADYPIADENHWSELESEEFEESLDQSVFDCLLDLSHEDIFFEDDSLWTDGKKRGAILEWIRIHRVHDYQIAWDNEGWLQDNEPVLDACAALGYLEYSCDPS